MLLLFYPNQLIRKSVPYDRLSILSNLNLLKFSKILQLKLTRLLWKIAWKLQHNPNSISMAVKNIFAHEASNTAGDWGAITAWTYIDFQIDQLALSLSANQMKAKRESISVKRINLKMNLTWFSIIDDFLLLELNSSIKVLISFSSFCSSVLDLELFLCQYDVIITLWLFSDYIMIT